MAERPVDGLHEVNGMPFASWRNLALPDGHHSLEQRVGRPGLQHAVRALHDQLESSGRLAGTAWSTADGGGWRGALVAADGAAACAPLLLAAEAAVRALQTAADVVDTVTTGEDAGEDARMA